MNDVIDGQLRDVHFVLTLARAVHEYLGMLR